MKTIERLGLIDRIGRDLQARMGYHDIDVFLKSCGVDVSRPTSGVNSKWVYTKELLSEVPEDVILKIANELEIPHAYAVSSRNEVVETTFWEPHHFRLFVSHISSFKKTVAALQRALRDYGISAFVAHVDIEPTREWQEEIEAGLMSMDALAAILMTGFKESKWTDQEVGVAIGRKVLVLPLIRDVTPYGLIGKYQGLQTSGKSVAQVAADVFGALVLSPLTRTRMLTCFVDFILQAPRRSRRRLTTSEAGSARWSPEAVPRETSRRRHEVRCLQGWAATAWPQWDSDPTGARAAFGAWLHSKCR